MTGKKLCTFYRPHTNIEWQTKKLYYFEHPSGLHSDAEGRQVPPFRRGLLRFLALESNSKWIYFQQIRIQIFFSMKYLIESKILLFSFCFSSYSLSNTFLFLKGTGSYFSLSLRDMLLKIKKFCIKVVKLIKKQTVLWCFSLSLQMTKLTWYYWIVFLFMVLLQFARLLYCDFLYGSAICRVLLHCVCKGIIALYLQWFIA